MYIVRIENDEAVMYRAFRRLQSAKLWAADRNAEDVDCLVDLLDAAGTDDLETAIAQAKSGEARRLAQVEALAIAPASMLPATDIEFGRRHIV